MHGSQAAALGGSLADVAATVCEHANARFVGESLVRVFNTNGSERDALPCLDFLGALSGSVIRHARTHYVGESQSCMLSGGDRRLFLPE